MNTVLFERRPDDRERLDTLTDLTRDTRVSLPDRLSLRLGLWLLLRAERRAQASRSRDQRVLQKLARDERVRLERESAWVQAAVHQQYR